MKYNSEFNPEKSQQQAEAIIKVAEDAFAGHVNFNIMSSFHKMAVQITTQLAKKGGDLEALFTEQINAKGDKEFKGLCPQGFDYFQQSLEHAFSTVSAKSPDAEKVKVFAKQVADMATVNAAQSTGAFDRVLRPQS